MLKFKSLKLNLMSAFMLAIVASAAANPGSNESIQDVNDAASTFTVISKTPLRLESVSTTSLCGRSMKDSDERVCLGEFPTEITANDTVSQFKHFALPVGHACALDERGVQCWKSLTKFNKPMQTILASGDSSFVRSGSDKVCVPQPDKTIVCHNAERGEWTAGTAADGTEVSAFKTFIPENEVYGPFADLRDFQVFDGIVCALDGEKVVCPEGKSPRFPIPTENFPGAKALSLGWDITCVLHTAGLTCIQKFEDKIMPPIHLSDWWTSATKIFPMGYDSICAVNSEQQPKCISLDFRDSSVTEVTSPELKGPDVRVLKFLAEGERKCALVQKASEPNSLICGNATLEKIPHTDTITDFSMNADVTCGVHKNGWISCFNENTHSDSPLPADGSKTETSGRCRWNSSRFHCSMLSDETDFSDIRKVISATPTSGKADLPCVIYENPKQVRQLICLGSSKQLEIDTPELTAEDTNVVASYNGACLYGGETTTCWGSTFTDAQTPNLSRAKKILWSSDFGCAADQFGFVCWGYKLEERGLNVPSNMGDLDFIVDFSLGDNHVCAITREARLECWGQNGSGQLNVPPVTNPTSISTSGDTNCVSSDEGITCWGPRTNSLLIAAP